MIQSVAVRISWPGMVIVVVMLALRSTWARPCWGLLTPLLLKSVTIQPVFVRLMRFDVAADFYGSGVGEDVREHVSSEWCHTLVGAEEIRYSRIYNASLPEFVDSNERIAAGAYDQCSCSLKLNLFGTKHLAAEVLWLFAGRETTRAVGFGGGDCQAEAGEFFRQVFDLSGIDDDGTAVADVVCELGNPFRRPINVATNDDGAVRVNGVNR